MYFWVRSFSAVECIDKKYLIMIVLILCSTRIKSFCVFVLIQWFKMTYKEWQKYLPYVQLSPVWCKWTWKLKIVANFLFYFQLRSVAIMACTVAQCVFPVNTLSED